MVMIQMIPEMGDVATYILLSVAQWTYLDLSLNFLVFGVVYVCIMLVLINYIKGLKFQNVIFMVCLCQGFNQMFNWFILIVRQMGYGTLFMLQIMQSLFVYFISDMTMIAVLGRTSRFFPEGFESTAITVIIAIGNVGIISSGLIAAQELSYFGVYSGYYDRMTRPILINCVLAIMLMLVYPFFVSRKVKRNKLASHQIISDRYSQTNYRSDKS